jgi:hypothetical protein
MRWAWRADYFFTLSRGLLRIGSRGRDDALRADRSAQCFHARRASIVTSRHIEVIRAFAPAASDQISGINFTNPKERVMTKAAAAFAIALALTATAASAKPQHHHRPVATGASTIDSGYGPPRNWNEIEVSVPSGGF